MKIMTMLTMMTMMMTAMIVIDDEDDIIIISYLLGLDARHLMHKESRRIVDGAERLETGGDGGEKRRGRIPLTKKRLQLLHL